MALNTCETWSNAIKIASFSKKSPSGWGLCLQTPKASGDWGIRPQTPVCDTFEFYLLTQHVPLVRHLHFSTISLKPSPFSKILVKCQYATASDFYYTISLSHKKFLLYKFFITSLHVICVLGPPIKNPDYAYDINRVFPLIIYRGMHRWAS